MRIRRRRRRSGPRIVSREPGSFYVTYTPAGPPPPPPVPVNTVLRVVSGSAQVGAIVSASTGTWSNTPTSYGYQWQRCDAGGGSCADLVGATSASYAVVAGDAGSTLRVVVIASNAGGPSAPAPSVVTAVVTVPPPPPVPVNTACCGWCRGRRRSARSCRRRREPGRTHRRRTGTIGGDVRRCGSCADLVGATSASYAVVAGDAGATLRVVVIASNTGGPSAPATSVVTAVVTTPPVTGKFGMCRWGRRRRRRRRGTSSVSVPVG